MSVTPTLPKGTRDLLPETMLRREAIIDVIKRVFKKYGFAPIETPAMESLSTLTGKYGEEGDRLIFKILNSGDFISKADHSAWEHGDAAAFGNSVSDKALRYDLTVPLARFVVQHQNELQFPFKRYQIQPVWRADRPQKGRFREFYQCDADVVGSDSLLPELDFIRIYEEVFSKLGIAVTIKINNRKVLSGLAESLNISERLTDFTIALDKLDKIGKEGVAEELKKRGFETNVITAFRELALLEGTNFKQLEQIKKLLNHSEIGQKGLEELNFIFNNIPDHVPLRLDLTLARGLDYYTGSIFEVIADDVEMGSIGGGGRYDDLTGIFGVKGLSGIGISFGLDRIQLVMEELGTFSAMQRETTEVMFINFGEAEALYALKLANELRAFGVKTEVYPDSVKVKRQMDYANKKNIPQVILIGSEEMRNEQFAVKNMHNGEQRIYSRIELLEHFTNPGKKDTEYGGRH